MFMSSTSTAATATEVADEVVKQMRSRDSYHGGDDRPAEQLLAPFVITKERKKEIPVTGDPDEETIDRVKAFYNALCTLIEKRTKLMAFPIVDIQHEGFGRGMITVGKLVVWDKTLRDVHRFGFPSVEAMAAEADKVIGQAVELIDKYRAVAD
jgi:probable nitrogen fixation protein